MVNNVLYRKIKCEQVVVRPETIRQIIQSLHVDPQQGHPGSGKMLHELRKRYYSHNLSVLVLHNISICQDCIQAKPIQKTSITPPLQQMYDHCNRETLDIVGYLV